jgi:hypothetical protein
MQSVINDFSLKQMIIPKNIPIAISMLHDLEYNNTLSLYSTYKNNNFNNNYNINLHRNKRRSSSEKNSLKYN